MTVVHETLEQALQRALPDTRHWASAVIVGGDAGSPTFDWHHAGASETAIDFWPASVVKLYTCVAAFEHLNELRMPTHSALVFERRLDDGRWVTDAARTLPEMCSTIFRDSDNDDYTLQLRFIGIDRINTRFFVAHKGFLRTALMRGYVHDPPYAYMREQPQRVTVVDPRTGRQAVVEHTWSGTSYSQTLGATVIDAQTGNCSPTRDMVECLRRVMFHELLPPEDQFILTSCQLDLLREGRDGFTGLRNTLHAFAWDDGVQWVFPQASYHHKPGNISDYHLDLAYVDDAASGTRFLLAVAAETGHVEPVRRMGRAVAEWVKRLRS